MDRADADTRVGAQKTAPSPGHRRAWNTAAVTLLALLLRLLVCAFAMKHFGAAWFFNRGTEVGFVAQSLLSGQGFASPFGLPTGPTALIAPGYPWLTAAVFQCAGLFTLGSAWTLMVINALLNAASVALVLGLARKVASERAAVLAALIPACALPLLWMPTIFWETSFSAVLLLGSIAAGLALDRGSSPPRWVAVGSMWSVAGLINPALLPTLAVIGVFAGWRARRGGVGKPVLALLAFTLIFLPWPVRNARVLGAFIPTRSTVGFELWMGNRDRATGFLDETYFPTFSREELARYQALGEVGYMAEKSSLASNWIRRHPGGFLRLTGLRIVRFWSGSGTRHGSLAYVLYACLTTLGAAWGLAIAWARGSQKRLLAGLSVALLVFPLPYYVTHAEFRYRLVLDPVLCVLAAVAIDRALNGKIRQRG